MSNTAWMQQARKKYLEDGGDAEQETRHTSLPARFLGGIGNAILHPLGGRHEDAAEEEPWRGSGVMPYSLPEELRKRADPDSAVPGMAGITEGQKEQFSADDGPGQDSPGTAPPPRQDGQVDPRYNRAADKYESVLREAPVRGKPHWYQQLAAAALGGAAGFSNAGGGHAHTPIDVSAVNEAILHPGHQRRMESWQDRVGPSKEILGVEAGRQKAEETAEQIAAQAEWRRSIGAQRRAQAAPHYGQTEVDAETGAAHGIQPDKDGRYYIPNTSVGQFTKPPKAEKTVSYRGLYDEAKQIFPNAPEEELRYFALNKGSMAGYGSTLQNDRKTTTVLAPGAALVDDKGKPVYTNPNRPLKEPDALATELREQRLADMKEKGAEVVTNRKVAGEQKLLHDKQGEIDGLLRRFQVTSVEDLRSNAPAQAALAEINRRYAPLLQHVQDEYARAVRARKGTADDFDVDPNTLEYKPRAAAAPPAPPAPVVAAPGAGGGGRGGQRPVKTWDPAEKRFK